MAIAIYQDLQGRQYWAEPSSPHTLRNLSKGTWVLVDDTPDTPPPPGDPLDNEMAERVPGNGAFAGALRAAFDARYAPIGGGGTVSIPRTSYPALGILQAGLAQRAATPCRLVFAGSSTTAGAAASTSPNRYVNRFVSALQAAYPSGLGSETSVVVSDTATFGTLSTAAGVHGYNVGQSSTTSNDYLLADEITRIGAANPRAVIHMIGSNDYRNGVAVATYKANMQAAIAALKAAMTQPCVHILVHSWGRFDAFTPANPWSAYGTALREIADADPGNVAFVDLSGEFEALGVPGTDPLDLIETDNVHGRDAAHAMTADLLYRGIFGKVLLTVNVTGSTPVTTLASDNFDRADSATLGTAPSGQAWSTNGGTWSISGNRATGSGGVAFLDAGAADMDVSSEISFGTATGVAGVTVHVTDVNNRITIYVDRPAGGASTPWTLAKHDAGTVSGLASGTLSIPDGATVPFRLVSKGAVVTAYLNGTQVATYTLTAGEQTKYKAVTRAGMRQGGAAAIYHDNFVVKAPA